MTLWLRAEARDTEQRTPLTPTDAARLIEGGQTITVERSARRIFPDEDYEAVGCLMVDAGAWAVAPAESLILGVKELSDRPDALSGTHAHFAHLYKEQRGWQAQLRRFTRGGGRLYDLEYLTGEDGARVAAFGYWAGWLGAAMAVQGWRLRAQNITMAGVAPRPSRQAFLKDIKALDTGDTPPRALVIGAKGRSGRGACALFDALDIPVTRWDKEETQPLDHAALLSHDILVSCVLLTGPGLTLVTPQDLSDPATQLRVISDVACDPLSDFNPLPIYHAPTAWDAPFLRLGGARDIWLTAIDNLPSLLPREASEDFSAQLLPTLQRYPNGIAWQNAGRAFDAAVARLDPE